MISFFSFSSRSLSLPESRNAPKARPPKFPNSPRHAPRRPAGTRAAGTHEWRRRIVIVLYRFFGLPAHKFSHFAASKHTHDMRTSHTYTCACTCTAGRLARCRAATAMCPTYSTLPTWLGDPMYKSENRGQRKGLYFMCVCVIRCAFWGVPSGVCMCIEEKERRD